MTRAQITPPGTFGEVGGEQLRTGPYAQAAASTRRRDATGARKLFIVHARHRNRPRSMLAPQPHSSTGVSPSFFAAVEPPRSFPAPVPVPRSACISPARLASTALSGASRGIPPVPSSAAMRSPVTARNCARSSAALSMPSSARSRARLISTAAVCRAAGSR